MSKVYASLTITSAVAAVGAYVHVAGIFYAGFLSTLGAIGLVLLIHLYPDNGKNYATRFAMLMGFGFLSGHGIGPLLENVIALVYIEQSRIFLFHNSDHFFQKIL